MSHTETNVNVNVKPYKKSSESKKAMKQTRKLEEFKSRIKDIMKSEYDDVYLNKWLKARQYDVNKAEQMIRESTIYRENMKIDALLESYKLPEVLEKYLAGGFCGFDLDASPVRIELFGRLDIKGLMYSARRSDLEKSRMLQCEQTLRLWKEQTKKLGRPVDGQTVLFDMEGVGIDMLWRPGLTMYLNLVKLMEDNYPEMMKRMFVINAPAIFPLMYKICRPLISDDTKDKIHVLGGDYTKTLLKYIDANQLPTFLGGTKTDPDNNPRCLSMIGQGGKVPESYYLADQDVTENMESATVPRADKLCIPVTIELPGSILRWEFTTEGYDMCFSVWREDSNGQRVTLVKLDRVDSHIMTEDGSLIVDVPGKHVVCFDNSFSWTRSKKIKYCIDVLTNEVDEDTKPELEKLIQAKDWDTLIEKFETTHL